MLHIHSYWEEEVQSVTVKKENTGANTLPSEIKSYAIMQKDRIRLPTFEMLDENFCCWWWNSKEKCWEYKFLAMIESNSVDNDYFIKDPQERHIEIALKLLEKGFTHFIPKNKIEH
jgi:hypothetical protein